MINITNMYFNYIKKYNIIRVDWRKSMIIGICEKFGCGKNTLVNQIIELTNDKALQIKTIRKIVIKDTTFDNVIFKNDNELIKRLVRSL